MNNIPNLKEYLRSMRRLRAEFQKRVSTGARMVPDQTLIEWLADNDAIARKGRPLPKDIEHGDLGYCFYNAWKLAYDHPDRFTYCEGLGFFIIPMNHAWCIDTKGRVVDPTWREHDREYLGVPFKLDYVTDVLLERAESFSLLDDWQGGYPIITGKVPPADWRADLLPSSKGTRT